MREPISAAPLPAEFFPVYLPGFFPPDFHLLAPEFGLFNPTLNPNLHPMFGDPRGLLTKILPGAYCLKVFERKAG
jgi:hypothetical protein